MTSKAISPTDGEASHGYGQRNAGANRSEPTALATSLFRHLQRASPPGSLSPSLSISAQVGEEKRVGE